MRLDRFIANNSHLSRKEAKLLLKQGSVQVDDSIIFDAGAQVQDDQQVMIDGSLLVAQNQQYLMLHKPAGYVCANRDAEHPVVFDLLVDEQLNPLHVVGRLDIDTTGLVLLTDDGQWSHRITSPRAHCKKLYRVGLQEPITEKMMSKLEEGVYLGEEHRRTLPAEVEIVSARECLLTIEEGRYHQVKRMMGAVGNRVIELHRESIGAIVLDENLTEGEYRPLTEEEIASVD